MPTRLVLLTLLALALVGCEPERQPVGGGANEGFGMPGGGDGSGEAEAEPAEATPVPVEIRIRPRGLRTAPGREPIQLTAVVYDAERQPLDVSVEWHSLDPEKVEVDALGRLTALGPLGPAFITASAGDVLAENVPVYVVDPAELPDPGADDQDEDEGSAQPEPVVIDATPGAPKSE